MFKKKKHNTKEYVHRITYQINRRDAVELNLIALITKKPMLLEGELRHYVANDVEHGVDIKKDVVIKSIITTETNAEDKETILNQRSWDLTPF